MAFLGQDRGQLNYKQDAGTMELRNFVESTIIAESPDVDRVTRYALFWNFYHGKHWRQYNETFLSFNYVRAFIDKINNFLVGKSGCTFEIQPFDNSEVKEDEERAIEGFIDYHWNHNNKATLLHDLLQMGSVTGDVWAYIGWDERKKACKIRTLDSRHSFPKFTDGDINRLEAFMLRQPLLKNDNSYQIYCIEYSGGTIKSWYQKDTQLEGKRFNEKESDNTYGFIPIVHIKNRPMSDGYYSRSDISDVLKINKTYNELGNEIKSIIDYYGQPTTVITGATAKTLKRGVGNIWSGLPAEANVFNLGLGEDLNSYSSFMQVLKTNMHELADVPENTLGKLQAISNTSAAALQITYQPLIQQADLKWLTYGDGIVEINKIIAKIVRKVEPSNELLKKCPKDFEELYKVSPVFTYGLPQDRAAQLNEANQELQMKIGSRREIMNRLGKKNVPALLKEIEADLVTLRDLEVPSDMSDTGGESSESGKVDKPGTPGVTSKKQKEPVGASSKK